MAARGAMPKKTKVLMVIARLNVGGPAIQAITLARELNNDEFDTLLVHGNVAQGEADMAGYRGMDVEQKLLLPELGRELHPVKDIVTLFKLIRIIRRNRPSIVHTHTAKAGAVGRAAAIICRVPVIVHTYHGHVFHGYFPPLKTALFKTIEKILARFTTQIIVLSPSQKREIHEILNIPENKLTIVPFGFDLARFLECRTKCRGEFRAAIGASPEMRIVSIVGRITAIKNHELFLQSAKIVLEKRSDVMFAVVGDGEDRPQCEQMARELGIAEKVIFAGWWEDVEKVYADTDVTVLTSKNEGTPVCILESLGAGVPVVATNVGGVADIVCDGKTGYVVPPGDAQAVAAKIGELLDDAALRDSMGAAGRSELCETCSDTKLTEDIVGLYRSLL